MNYKKIFKKAKTRNLILNLFRFLPDSIMLSWQYRIKLGRKPNLKSPQRFTEKIQWYKMHYRNPLMHKCVDKYIVRDYVTSKGLESILVPLIGIYSSFEEINWEELPPRFIAKITNGGGGLNVFVCLDKKNETLSKMSSQLSFTQKPIKTKSAGREWAYYGLFPKIIIEELLVNENDPNAGINDYKFLCYGGRVKYIVVDVDRYSGHKRNVYDVNWNKLDLSSDCPNCDRIIKKPERLDEMIVIAEKLASDFPFVRVDLYNCSGKVFFGELTFYPWSGYVQFSPDNWDLIFGKDFPLIPYKETKNG